jgi:hypothetical protein
VLYIIHLIYIWLAISFKYIHLPLSLYVYLYTYNIIYNIMLLTNYVIIYYILCGCMSSFTM